MIGGRQINHLYKFWNDQPNQLRILLPYQRDIENSDQTYENRIFYLLLTILYHLILLCATIGAGIQECYTNGSRNRQWWLLCGSSERI